MYVWFTRVGHVAWKTCLCGVVVNVLAYTYLNSNRLWMSLWSSLKVWTTYRSTPLAFYDFHHWHVPAMSVDPHLVDGLSQILRSFVLNPSQSPIISWVFLKGQSLSHKQFRSVTNCSTGSVFAYRLLCCGILVAESTMSWPSLCPHQWYGSMYWRYIVPFYNTISINNNTFRRLSLVASEPIKMMVPRFHRSVKCLALQ